MQRKPVVAGYFYPGDIYTLTSTLQELIVEDEEKINALGIIVPHAGYIYSGKVAGRVYGKIEIPDVVLLLGPNHTGLGERISLFNGKSFLTPLGEVKINKSLSELILKYCPLVKEDSLAHSREHSLEVQVPFLQYLNPEVEIVPILLIDLNVEELNLFGKAIANAIREFEAENEQEILIVVSSDFSHYEPKSIAERKDNLAIEEILNLSEEGLLKVVYENRISMCGILPVFSLIVAAKELGRTNAELVDYKTSDDVTGDYSSVVGYAGIIIY